MSAHDPTRSAGDPTGTASARLPADPSATAPADPDPPDPGPPDPVPGYELLGPLGEGGMGVVVKARQAALGRVVALKMPLGGHRAGPRELVRFLAEAEAVAAVDHPHVVRVYDFAAAGGRPYLAMEFCPGGTLADRLKRSGRLPPPEAAGLVRKVSAGVAAAHAAGVVHRDLKPANVLFDAAGEPKVADFGLAKRSSGGNLTHTQAILGTPQYMAPEQADGRAKSAGPPADVWALGVVLYECLTGAKPFDAADSLSILHRVRHDDPARPRSLASAIPRDLELICLKCLEKDPADRYPTAAELSADLGRFLAGEPVGVRSAGAVERAAKWAKRKPTLAAAYAVTAVAVLLAGLTAGAVWLWQRAEHDRHDAVTARDELGEQKKAVEATRDELAKEREKLAAVEYGRTIQVAHQAWRDNNVAVARALLAGTRADLRGWEYGYVHRLCHPDHLALSVPPMPGRDNYIYSVSFSPDGQRVATAGVNSGTAQVWDVNTGKVLIALKVNANSIISVSYSPDGRRLATTDAEGVGRVWEASTGTELLTLKGKVLGYAAFSPDGRRVAAAANDAAARVWDAETGAELIALKGRHEEGTNSVVFSPDGRRVATAGMDGTARLWDTETGNELITIKARAPWVNTATFSPDGRRLATSGSDGTARVWDVETGQEVLVLRGHERLVRSAMFSPDGKRILTAGVDHTARVWDATTGTVIITLNGHATDIYSAVFSPDGRRVATAGGDGVVRVWDVAADAEESAVQGSPKRRIPMAYSLDGMRLLMRGRDEKTGAAMAEVCDAATGAALLRLKGHTDMIWGAAFSPDGRRIVTRHEDSTARVWDAETGQELLALNGHTASIFSAAFSPAGQLVATAGGGTARVWDTATGKELLTLKGKALGLIAFSPNGQRLATTGDDGIARVWDVTGIELLTLNRDASRAYSAVFSPDGRRVATATEDGTRVWDADSGKELLVLRGHVNYVWSPVFSPDGRRLVTIGPVDQTARVWDTATGAEVLAVRRVYMAAFSPDGRRLMTASEDGTTQVLDATPAHREFRPKELAPPPRPAR